MTVSARSRRHVGKRSQLPVQTLDKLQARLIAARATGMTWRDIAAHFQPVPAGTLCAIAKGRDPKSPAIRAALGLPAYQAAEVCPVHHIVHTGRCPRKSTDTYDAWRQRNMPALLAIVAWAEARSISASNRSA